MNESVFITQSDALDDNEIMVNLSDGRSLRLTLEQILAADPEIVPEPEED
jgi:hypothetical protein